MAADEFTLQCTVITPEGEVLDEPVVSVVLPAHDGLIGILFNRAPLVCQLGVGVLSLRGPKGKQRLFIDQGFAEVLHNKVAVLTQRALLPDQINRPQAEEDLKQAQAMRITDEASLEARTNAIARAKTQLALAAG